MPLMPADAACLPVPMCDLECAEACRCACASRDTAIPLVPLHAATPRAHMRTLVLTVARKQAGSDSAGFAVAPVKWALRHALPGLCLNCAHARALKTLITSSAGAPLKP